jgi:endonuclease/exonuclease/phosphatase family metal-dependent hydrolase
MGKFLLKIVGAATLAFLLAIPLSAQYSDTVKIMTYNINAETHSDGDYTDIGDVIKAINPTIAGLQKVDSCTVTAAPVYVLKSLGQQTNMFHTFSMSYTKNSGSYGNGFLSDSLPKSTRHCAIPKGSASEDRSALEIGVTVAGEPVRVIVTHLDYANATNRTAQIQKIIPWIDSGGARTVPAVIMADFNAQSNESSMNLFVQAGFVYVKTASGTILDTTQKINHILYRPENRWKIVDAGNPVYTAASNRNPLWALMSLLNPVAVKPVRPEKAGNGNRPHINITNSAIRCVLPSAAVVTMRLFDLTGKKVRTIVSGQLLDAGQHSFAIKGNSLPKGTYLLESRINSVLSVEKFAEAK